MWDLCQYLRSNVMTMKPYVWNFFSNQLCSFIGKLLKGAWQVSLWTYEYTYIIINMSYHFVKKLTSGRNDLSEEQLEKLFSSING